MMGAMSCLECMNAVLRAAAYYHEEDTDEETAKVGSGNWSTFVPLLML